MEQDKKAAAGGPRAGKPNALAATRLSLLTRLKHTEDYEGWQRFFDTYGAVIHAMGVRAGLNQAEADDALQETLLSVAREVPGFKYDPTRGSFKSWLFQITRRRIVDQFRLRMRHQRHADAGALVHLEESAPGGDPLNQLWEDEWRQNQVQVAIDRVKQKVTPRQWQMFDLGSLQNWPTTKICGVLGVNRAQLYMAKMRVGKMLKDEVANLPQEGPW